MLIGVLALQGNFAKHEQMLKSMGLAVRQVRKPADLEGCDGLIIPGGESTVMLRQMNFIELKRPLLEFAKNKPVFGTCAGLILMSNHIEGSEMMPLGLLDVTVERNAYGRQIESFESSILLNLNKDHEKVVPAFFIRAPRIRSNGKDVSILGLLEEEPVLVQQGFHLGATFHPELTGECTIHEYFIQLVQQRKL
ncbi:MAG: pyridoxal 5'-phosphate synthase glutaminase subunit PdxT [Candidatus Protochlamydia sp.]|nr:pyridoxal 5'-phosphate synthase glutaminase subunit PdxT [Candidatus Protochlamydia sp.]